MQAGVAPRRGITRALGLMFKVNPIPKFGLLGWTLPFVYLLAISGQERAKDFLLTGDEMYWPEEAFLLLCLAPIMATWCLSMYRAHLAGSWTWFIGCLMAWPLAFVYTLFVNRGDSP